MGLLDRIAERQQVVRSDPVTLEEFGYLLGRNRGQIKTRSGVTVDPNRALAIPAWYSGVRYLSETVASLPVHTFRDTAAGRSQRADPPWLKRPDVETTRFSLFEHWMMSLLHRGNAFSFKRRDPVGRVVGLRPVHPDRVKVGQADDGTKRFQIDNREDLIFTTREIFHIPGLSYDGIVGLDPISGFAGESLGRIAAADEFASRHFSQGTHLQGYISVGQDLTQTQLDGLKDQWSRFHRGLANAHEFGVLGNGSEYKTISLNPEQMQLLESRRYGIIEVAQILRIPPHKLYELSRATYSNIEHQSIEAVMDGIRPWVERVEEWTNFDLDLLPAGNFVEFDLEGLLRGDIKTRYEAYSAGINAGFLMPAEPRRRENLPFVDGTEYLNVPLNMGQVGPDARPTPPEPLPSPPDEEAT